MTETPKTFTLLPNKEPGVYATLNGVRVLEATLATEDDQIGVEFERIPLKIGMGSLSDPLPLPKI